MTLKNKFKITMDKGKIVIEVTSNASTIEEVISGMMKGMSKGGFPHG